jgi:c-di-GMP-binding flagellar brake protein YcgR
VSGKRRHRRYLLSSHLMAAPDNEEQPGAEHSRALDISESGLGGLFHESWPVGSRVKLEVSLPVEQTPLKVGAIVRHHTGVRYGFEFVDISLEQRRILQRACEALAKGRTG